MNKKTGIGIVVSVITMFGSSVTFGYFLGVASECGFCSDEAPVPEEVCSDTSEVVCGGAAHHADPTDQKCRSDHYSKCMADYREQRSCKADCMDIVSRLTDARDDYYARWIACAEGEPE